MTRNFEKISQDTIKMNSKTIGKLRSIARDKSLRGYHRLTKANLVASLFEQSTEEMPTLVLKSSRNGLIWKGGDEKERAGGKK